ncbi:MAG: amidohydrolase family protein [Candidatus Latescibacteria bacterium]|nr:amidohydrolase family protein [Candidatus Latescibacterota bacterium]
MRRIDAHLHYPGDSAEDRALLDKYQLKLFNISVPQPDIQRWRARTEQWRQLALKDPAHFGWCAGFDLPRFDDAEYYDAVFAELDRDRADGALACKIWKNVGMEVLKPDGSFMMVDDPFFDPIYDYLEQHQLPLLLHIGEPLACWQPLDDPDDPHYNYYKNNPQWHMHGRADFPAHAFIMEARDNLVAKRPKLRIIGAHLASLEYDVDEIARRLDQFPNFAVDTSARLGDLARQDSTKVRQFITHYRDRILWGTDMVHNGYSSELTPQEQEQRIERAETTYKTEFAYYETAGPVTVRDKVVEGLGLAEDLLEDLYWRNAQRWYPGL